MLTISFYRLAGRVRERLRSVMILHRCVSSSLPQLQPGKLKNTVFLSFFSWIFHIEVSYEVAVLVLIRFLNYLRLLDATEVLYVARFVCGSFVVLKTIAF